MEAHRALSEPQGRAWPGLGLTRRCFFFVVFFFHLSVFDTQSSEALIAGKALGNPSLHLSLYRQ